MKVIFDKKELLSALLPAAGISQTKNTLVACEGLLFECPPDPRFGNSDSSASDRCRISSFDFEKGLRTDVGCTILEPGSFLLNTQSVLQIVRALPDGDLTVTVAPGGAAVFSGGKVNFRTTAASGDNFPAMPLFSGAVSFRVPQYSLRRVLAQTVFAIAQNELQRTGFSGGLFRLREGSLAVTGCDNHKLALARCTVPEISGGGSAEFLLPGKFLGELYRLLRDTEEDVSVTVGRKHVFFKLGNLLFFTRILETDYPEYEKMLPVSYMTEAIVSRTELLDAAERAAIVAEAKLGGIGGAYIKLDFQKDRMVISSVASGGAVDETLTPELHGANLTIGFESRNLLDTLRTCPVSCERLRLRLNTPLLGMLIEPESGSAFLETRPDPSVFGELPAPPKLSASEQPDDFLYFVLPTRMNIPGK